MTDQLTKYHRQRPDGFTLVELIMALGIMTLIGLGVSTLIKHQMDAARYNTARESAQAEVERVFTDIRKSWLSRRQTQTSKGFAIDPEASSTNNSLTVIMGQRNATATSPNSFSIWRTVCRPVPPALNLKPAVLSSLSTMAAGTCGTTCPAGQRPVIQFHRGVQGDFNNDGVVDAQDLVVLANSGAPTTVPTGPALPGDANRDGVIDAADAAQLLSRGLYNTNQPATWDSGDFNGDGVYNILDNVAMLSNTNGGMTLPPTPTPAPPGSPSTLTTPIAGLSGPLPGNLLYIPGDSGGGPSRESILGLSVCFAEGSNVAIKFQSGFLNMKGDLQIVTRQVELRFENEYGSGVEVLR